MPTKEYNNSQIWFTDESGRLHLAGELQEAEVDGNYEIPENLPFFKSGDSNEMTFEIIPPERMTIGDIF